MLWQACHGGASCVGVMYGELGHGRHGVVSNGKVSRVLVGCVLVRQEL